MSSHGSNARTGIEREKVRQQFGVAFEEENERADLERWRKASDAERSRAIVEVIELAEEIAARTGIRNEEPAPRFPVRSRQTTESD